MSGNGVGTRISADQYASDTYALQNMVRSIYQGIEPKPLIIAPGGFFDENWFKDFIDKTTQSADVITHHIYNLGPGIFPSIDQTLRLITNFQNMGSDWSFYLLTGVDEHLVERILDPSYLDGMVDTFYRLHEILKSSPTSAKAWVGEAGGAYNSGHNLVTNAFVFSFW